MPISESTRLIRMRLAWTKRPLHGWEAAFVDAREQITPALFAAALGEIESQLVAAACGERYRPRPHHDVLICPRCRAPSGFRRRGRRRRQIFTRIGALDLRIAMVGCRCGHRFAPLLRALGLAPRSRCAPGFERRVLELCTELPYRRAAAALRREAGAAPSERTLRRLVRAAAARCDLRAPRSDLGPLDAVLVDGTRVRAGPKKRARDDRGLELHIALAVAGRTPQGAALELLGATFGRAWPQLGRPLRAARGAAIAISDGDWGISALLRRTLPMVPQQICTFHVRDSIDHRLWQDGLRFAARRALARAFGNAIEYARDETEARGAVHALQAMAVRHHWRHTAAHLAEVAPHLTTWLGLGSGAHTTSLLERLMREVNRRVDPVGVRWSREGAAAIIELLLARRFTPTGDGSAMMAAQFRSGPSSNESTICRAISGVQRSPRNLLALAPRTRVAG